MLLPLEEEGMLKRLKIHKIEPKLMNIKQKSKKSIRPQLQSLCFKDPVMKNLGQRAFIAYFKSVHIQKIKMFSKLRSYQQNLTLLLWDYLVHQRSKLKGESNKERRTHQDSISKNRR